MFRKALIGAALALSAVSVFASQTWSTLTPVSAAFSGDESSLFTFDLSTDITGGFSFVASGSDLASVQLDGVLFSEVLALPDTWTYTVPAISAGSHSLLVLTGPLFGKGLDTFSGTFTVKGAILTPLDAVAAPVPEPETYAMMLAGLGAIGFMARRRQAK